MDVASCHKNCHEGCHQQRVSVFYYILLYIFLSSYLYPFFVELNSDLFFKMITERNFICFVNVTDSKESGRHKHLSPWRKFKKQTPCQVGVCYYHLIMQIKTPMKNHLGNIHVYIDMMPSTQ